MGNLNQPLSNVQLEILKAFSYDLSEEELNNFKNVIAKYFADKAIAEADKSWNEKKWTDKDVDRMLKTKMRSTKK